MNTTMVIDSEGEFKREPALAFEYYWSAGDLVELAAERDFPLSEAQANKIVDEKQDEFRRLMNKWMYEVLNDNVVDFLACCQAGL